MMHAIGYKTPAPITEAGSLVDIQLPTPMAEGRDLLVEIKAVSVNPVDYKVRLSPRPNQADWKVLGWDAAGVIRSIGGEVKRFRPGDPVFYAGSLSRPGTNAEFHLVDERIVGTKPKTLSWAQAAALPLTALTAWESLFERLDVKKAVSGATPAILIVGGAGGVGSVAIQMARALTDLTVVATASRPESREWVSRLGAHHVIDHSKPLAGEFAALGIGAPAFVFSTTQTAKHIGEIEKLIAPQGRFGLIDDPSTFDAMIFKPKSVSIHHEFMFTRSMFGTADMGEQGKILDDVSRLVDEGRLETTLTQRLSPINAENLKIAHALLESGAAIGKIVLEGFAHP